MKENTVKKLENRKVLALKTVLAAVAAMSLLVAGMGAAFGDQAKSSSASAFGLEATGILPIAKTPTAAAVAPPDGSQENKTTLKVPAAALAVNATLNAKAEAHFNDGTKTTITAANARSGTARSFRPTGLNDVNTRAYASAENLKVLVNTPLVDCNATPENCLAAVSSNLIETEAVAKCVNNQPVFDTGYNRLGLDILSLQIGPVLNPLLDPIFALLGPAGALAAVAKVEEGVVDDIIENGQKVGVSIDALRISVLGTTEVIKVAHSEVRMPRDCAPPVVASPAPKLAQTGGGGLSSLIGASLVMGAVLMMIFVRKFRLSQ